MEVGQKEMLKTCKEKIESFKEVVYLQVFIEGAQFAINSLSKTEKTDSVIYFKKWYGENKNILP